MIIADIVKVTLPAVMSFVVGILITPIVSNYLYRNKMWKKKAGKVSMDGKPTPIFNELHKDKEVNTPRMGGLIIWISVAISIISLWLASHALPSGLSTKLDFLSRNQKWLPFFALIVGSLVGLTDDVLEIQGNGGHAAGGMSLKNRLFAVATIGLIAGSWFYFKLDISSLGLPGGNILPLGIFFIPFFALITMAVYSGGVIDGIDGLAGGIFATMFSARSTELDCHIH